jgi:hypothetical protein
MITSRNISASERSKSELAQAIREVQAATDLSAIEEDINTLQMGVEATAQLAGAVTTLQTAVSGLKALSVMNSPIAAALAPGADGAFDDLATYADDAVFTEAEIAAADKFYLLGESSVIIGTRATVNGEILCRGSVVMNDEAFAEDVNAGGTITLNSKVIVDGDVTSETTIDVTNIGSGYVSGTSLESGVLEAPVSPTMPAAPFAEIADGNEIIVRLSEVQPIAPGVYGGVDVRNGTLQFTTAGTYNMRYLKVHGTGILSFPAGVVIVTNRTFEFAGTLIGREGLRPLTVYSTQDADISAPFHGSVFVPNANLLIQAPVSKGSYVGQVVTIGASAVVWPSLLSRADIDVALP